MKKLEMTKEEISEFCEIAAPNEPIIIPDDFDDAFLGVSVGEDTPQAVYSIERCIQILAQQMSQKEAEEYFWFNVAGSLGKGYPLYIYTPEDDY